MSLRISDFFWEDLIEEQHIWTIEQMAFFYQTSTEEVINALTKANEKYAEDPRSTNYSDPDSDSERSDVDALLEEICGDVHGPAGKDRVEGSS